MGNLRDQSALARRPMQHAATALVVLVVLTLCGSSSIGSRQKQLLDREDWERVQAIRQVAHALSLYTSSKFRAPRMFMVGPLARAQHTRADNDNNGLTDAMTDADLIAQAAEIRALGLLWPSGFNDLAIQRHPPRKAAVMIRIATLLEQLWPAIQQLSEHLLGQRTLLGSQFSSALDSDLGFNPRQTRTDGVAPANISSD